MSHKIRSWATSDGRIHTAVADCQFNILFSEARRYAEWILETIRVYHRQEGNVPEFHEDLGPKDKPTIAPWQRPVPVQTEPKACAKEGCTTTNAILYRIDNKWICPEHISEYIADTNRFLVGEPQSDRQQRLGQK